MKILTGGLVQVGDRTQFLGAATALGAILYAVAQYLTGTDMGLMDLLNLVTEKWEVILAGLVTYTGGAKVQRLIDKM